ncbi:MAG TPA: FAD-dependent monooxygenase [Steroidobacteraceae bacterium]|nr:FAD-dependent monooxygenase [Steroidobacteraceae bacterium]
MNDPIGIAAATEPLDVLIVGGGPVGASAAALLQVATKDARRPLRVAVLELNRPAASRLEAPLDSRVSALSRASERILTAIGAWSLIPPARVQPYERMRVWHESVQPRSDDVLEFDAAFAGEPNLGYIVENRLVQAAALTTFETAGGKVISGELSRLRVHDHHVELETSTGTLACRLVVGADGARSMVRESIGLAAETSSYRQTAIVANVRTELPHERTAWQRFLRTGTLAFLPLADGCSSVVWSADDTAAAPLLAMSPSAFEEELLRQSDAVLGAVKLRTERLSFPLHKLTAHRFTAHRCALIGDAAHVVHPLAGQGVNLGLLDAAALCELLCAALRMREDPGAQSVLRRYERWRKSEIEPIALAIDGFNRYLAHGVGPLSRIAQRGLALVNRTDEVKRFFITRALGLDGELPKVARQPPSAPPATFS